MIGVTYGQAEWASAASSFRAVGKVAMDETHVVRVHPKIDGWIEQVFTDFMGAPVEKGQRLLTIYSPEMLAAEQDYLAGAAGAEDFEEQSAGRGGAK